MGDKISPAQKKMGRDGFRIGGDHTCLTTASDNEGNVFNNNAEQTLPVFNSAVGEGKAAHKSSGM